MAPGAEHATRDPSRRAPGRVRGAIGAFLASLDPKSRRTLIRLTGELILLTAVVAVIYGGPALRGGSRPSTGEPSIAQAPSLGIAAAEVTAVFAIERFGGFEFAPDRSSADASHLIGLSADGATTLDLAGDSGNLRRITMTMETSADWVLDGAQRRHLSALLVLFAPDTLDAVLGELIDALDSGRDADLVVRSGGVAVRLTVDHSTQHEVVVALAPFRSEG